MEIYRDVGKGGGNGLGICWFLRKIAGTPGWRWDIMVPTSNDAFCREGVIFVPATPAAEGCGLPSKIVFINHASYKGARIHCDDGRQKGIQKRKSDYSSGICQPEAFPATLYIMPSLCQQMPVACTETRFHGIRSGRCDAANGQFRKRIL